MTEFHKDGFSVHVYTGSSPAEAWLRLHKELAWLMEKVSGDDAPRGMYAVCSLFDALMPSWKQACFVLF